MNIIKKTILIAAWCGTGKTYICEKTNINAIEIEYWKYKDIDIKNKYIEDIKKNIGNVDYIFISTDPEGLMLLYKEGFEIILVYPKKELRNDYLNRYIKRDDPHEFIGAFMKYWDSWIDELKKQTYCKHIVLRKNEYLQSVMPLNINICG